jgi:hypothetical protein
LGPTSLNNILFSGSSKEESYKLGEYKGKEKNELALSVGSFSFSNIIKGMLFLPLSSTPRLDMSNIKDNFGVKQLGLINASYTNKVLESNINNKHY